MNRYRNVPGLRGPTKASQLTLCQKCLKRGHYSFECKVSAQERPYISRPSRTQQLQDPALVPKLTSEVSNDLQRTTGVADEVLAMKEQERGRIKYPSNQDEGQHGLISSKKRTRSVSSYSSISASTISTNLSRSRSPKHRRRYDSADSQERHLQRVKSSSPSLSTQRKRRYSEKSSRYSYSSGSSVERRSSRIRERRDERNIRRRRRESSPDERGRRRDDSSRRGSWRGRSQSQSRDRSRIMRGRRSLPPVQRNTTDPQRSIQSSYRPLENAIDRRSEHRERNRAGYIRGNPSASPQRERSLSPFSKRLALTLAMNTGR